MPLIGGFFVIFGVVVAAIAVPVGDERGELTKVFSVGVGMICVGAAILAIFPPR